jgi:hypothetical protein
MGISRSTYYRRRAKARGQAALAQAIAKHTHGRIEKISLLAIS